MSRAILRAVLAIAMTTLGVFHFVHPDDFAKMIPDAFPAHLVLVWVSGFFEIAGGVGILVPRTRRVAAYGLMALFVAVFPANVHMAIHPDAFGTAWLLWARLPLQPLFIVWAYFVRHDSGTPSATSV